MENDRRLAVLIDADNVSSKYIKSILNEISNHGTPTYKRIYGDWTTSNMSSWKNVLLDHSITPIQQYSYTKGKNATDASLIIDAMDILYTGRVEGFCLVSSDSDFTRLASRLRESGMYVLGMGEEKTPKAFRDSCVQFKLLEALAQMDDNKNAPSGKQKSTYKAGSTTSEAKIIVAITDIVDKSSGDDGWANLGEVGSKLSKRYTDFDTRNYGYKKLSDFINSLKKFDIELRKAPNAGGANNYIRNKK
ncbi:MAG: NYN domain-containing protein [Eubacteriales bacterium]